MNPPYRPLLIFLFFTLGLAPIASAIDEAPKFSEGPSVVFPFDLKRAIAQRKAVGFKAVVEFTVTVEGKVIDAKVVETDHPLAGDAALTAVRQWKFKPGKRDGVALAARMQVPVFFTTSKHPTKLQKPEDIKLLHFEPARAK